MASTLAGGGDGPFDNAADDSRALLLLQQLSRPANNACLNVIGAKHTRRSFLDHFFRPLIVDRQNAETTLGDVLAGIQDAVDRLHRFDIFDPSKTQLYISSAEPTDPSTTPTDLVLSLTVAEKPRFFLKTGTSVGNSEASGYTTLHLRNLLGGGEALSLNASAGTRTRGSFGASLSTPIAGNPDVTAALEADSVTTTKPWASCDEGVARVGGKVSWRSATSGDRQTLGIATAWRTITGLLPTASPTVRADAGDSVKTSLTHTWLRERRDSPVLPHEGYMLRAATELAGWGPLGRVSDVAFLKGEWEAQGAVPLALPPSASLWSSLGRSAWEARLSKSGVALNIGLRAGLLYPLPLGAMDPTSSLAQPSRLPDRFTLGGPNDVRGFAQGGLGPRDGRDAVGGDVFAAGSAALVVPVTRGGRDSPLRLQLFANAGRLTALTGARGSGPVEKPSTTQPSNSPQGAMDATTVWKGVKAAVAELANGAPSSAAGIGLVYAHPVARFELNFSLPLALRRGEEGVKGLQIGVGVTYL